MHQSHITGKQLLSCPFILPTPSLPQKRESTQVYHNDARVFTSILDSSLHWNDGGVPVEPRTKPLVLSLSKDAPRSCYRRAVAEPPFSSPNQFSCQSGNPRRFITMTPGFSRTSWIPAFAGMTVWRQYRSARFDVYLQYFQDIDIHYGIH